ncbi:MAG: PIN domain-containing protein [Verrucomicrobia bacterium]|nr:PIN domain-containing protein [Verrucomicrobiota bacterium]
MISVDTNLLVYAHREDSDFHSKAIQTLRGLSEGGTRWCIPWPCVHEFLAITTHPRIFDPPSPLSLALEAMDVWIHSPGCEMIGEDTGYFDVLKQLATQGKIVGPMIHDARIAAICVHHGVQELFTADRDFSRFAKLKTRSPLANP